MLLEVLEYLLTPASRSARALGFLKSTIQVRARYRRCRAAWRPHLEATRAWILEVARQCPSRRKVVLLGAGLLHDVPVRELSELFDEVVLVDVVHPLSSRMAVWRLPNVHQICHEVTGVVSALAAAADHSTLPVSFPELFTNDPALDLTISLNLLSQLSWVPEQILSGRRPAAEVDAYLAHLQQAHIDYLRRLPGHTALVTDMRWSRRATNAKPQTQEPEESWDVLHHGPMPPPTRQWEWRIAPAPEREPEHDLVAIVGAYSDCKAAWR